MNDKHFCGLIFFFLAGKVNSIIRFDEVTSQGSDK
jgi:hypothetical protein